MNSPTTIVYFERSPDQPSIGVLRVSIPFERIMLLLKLTVLGVEVKVVLRTNNMTSKKEKNSFLMENMLDATFFFSVE